MDRLDLVLPDGRSLEVLTSGPRDAMPLLFHVGTPMAATPFEPLAIAAARAGLRTITYSRPGYGRSTRHPGHTVADAAADARVILDRSGADRFVTLGWSGGGSRALACAAVLGERCAAAASVAAVAPYSAAFEWFAGMSPGNVKEFSAAVQGADALEAYLGPATERARTLQKEAVRGWFGPAASGPETAALADAFADFVATSFRKAVAQGPGGWLDDDLALTRDWGFDLASIDRPVAIWHGGADTLVPVSHGKWMAARIPGARSHFYEEHDHMTLPVAMLDAIVKDLVSAAAGR